MTWLLWRQHRLQAAVSLGLLAALGLTLGVTGVHMADVYREGLARCQGCVLVGSLFQGYGAVLDVVNVTVAVPVLLGVVFGAVLIARETEHATHILVWTQGVSRRRWLLTKLATTVTAGVVCSAALTALVTWWAGTPNALYHNRFDPLKFDTQNLMPVAFALFAVGLGIAAGAVLRRTLPAIAVTVGGFLALRLAVEIYLRPHYQKAVSVLSDLRVGGSAPAAAWLLNSTLVDPAGHPVGHTFDPSSVCATIGRPSTAECLNRLGYHIRTTFQPAARYWHFQVVETAIFAVVGAGLIVTGALVTLRRDA